MVVFLIWSVTLRKKHLQSVLEDKATRFPALRMEGNEFMLNGKPFRILSGAVHYFRVPPASWRDRLIKLKAAGLNTVETYVAWNMHEPRPGEFDFTGICDIKEFIKVAKDLGLHVIIRPGPYICAEWDLGGLPAWLLHNKDMTLRTMHGPYLAAVARYFDHLFQILNPLQASYGGPIIAFQVENEYLSYGTDKEYLNEIYKMMKGKGIKELLFTSDGPPHLEKAVQMLPDDVLVTVNFQSDPEKALNTLKQVQPNKPLFVAEFWTGWFAHWKEKKLERHLSAEEFEKALTIILKMNASVNLYMFHGGTNFGFMNGANLTPDTEYHPTITSYDYDAPLSEGGVPRKKYFVLRQILPKLVPTQVHLPLKPVPESIPPEKYGDVSLTLALALQETFAYIPKPVQMLYPAPMEFLPINDNTGQGYGFVMYRASVTEKDTNVELSQLKDHGVVLLNGVLLKSLSWFNVQNFQLDWKKVLDPSQLNSDEQYNLDIIVENLGRVNYIDSSVRLPLESRKGILGKVMIDKQQRKDWLVYSFEFTQTFVSNIDAGGLWKKSSGYQFRGPTLYRGAFNIEGAPRDTFAVMSGWSKGVLFVNNVNLGRYWDVGPQTSLYIPASVLRRGTNRIIVFELNKPRSPLSMTFTDIPEHIY